MHFHLRDQIFVILPADDGSVAAPNDFVHGLSRCLPQRHLIGVKFEGTNCSIATAARVREKRFARSRSRRPIVGRAPMPWGANPHPAASVRSSRTGSAETPARCRFSAVTYLLPRAALPI